MIAAASLPRWPSFDAEGLEYFAGMGQDNVDDTRRRERPQQTDGVGDLGVRCGSAGLDLLCFSLLRWIVCRSIRPTHPAPGGDLPGDVVRVASDALDLLGGH